MITTKFEDEIMAKSSVLNTKLTILKASAKVFSEKGFEATSIRDIAKTADIPHSSVTYHFGNKQALFETVIKNLFKETFEIASSFDIDERTENVLVEFENYLLKIAHFYYSHPEFLMILNKEGLGQSEHLEVINEDLRKLKANVHHHLKICQNLGAIVNIPLDELQLLFSGAFQSLFIGADTDLYQLSEDAAQERLKTHVQNVVRLLARKGAKETDNPSFYIRKANEGDTEDIVRLGRRSVTYAHRESSPREILMGYINANYNDEAIEKDLRKKANHYCMIEDESHRPIGFSKIIVDQAHSDVKSEAVAKLDRIYILREYYGKKLGYELLKFNMDLACELNQKGLWLYTWVGNERAINFYLRTGFEIVGRHNFHVSGDYYNPNHVMFLDLSK